MAIIAKLLSEVSAPSDGESLVVVILAGGIGSRLWPLSSGEVAKQFLVLDGSGQTLLAKTLQRAKALTKKILIITSESQVMVARAEVNACALVGVSILVEPCRKNTAAAVAVAMGFVSRLYGEDTNVLLMPADHVIADEPKFLAIVHNSLPLTRSHPAILFGLKPESPNSGYGYITVEQVAPNRGRIKKFIEKPNASVLADIFMNDDVFVNSGIILAKPNLFITEFEQYTPEIINISSEIVNQIQLTEDLDITLNFDLYKLFPTISIDYALMEKTDNALCVPLSVTWSDVGSWSAVQDLWPRDLDKNSSTGLGFFYEAHGNFIWSKDRRIVVVGVNNLAVVNVNGVVLVCDIRAPELLKDAVKWIEEELMLSAEPSKVSRPWGTYEVLVNRANYCVKEIVVNGGASISLQYHQHRAEHWVILSGSARVTCGTSIVEMSANDSIFIEKEKIHRLENSGEEPCVILETQIGDYLGEDDIVRLEDIYGRVL